MYEITMDSQTLYRDGIEEFTIIDPVLSLELNTAGSLTFTIYPDHPLYSQVNRMKSIVSVYRDGTRIFRGRVLSTETDWLNAKSVTVEGELAYLNDSITRPYDFTGEDDGVTTTIEEHLSFLLDQHNSQVEEAKQFLLGNVTVTTEYGYDSIGPENADYTSTWENINNDLIDELGGYLQIRYDDDGNRYLDYLSDLSQEAGQEVRYGFNLLDISHTMDGEDIATVIVPLGAEDDDTGEKLTVYMTPLSDTSGYSSDQLTTDSDGNICYALDYVEADSEVIEEYGRIVKVKEWDYIVEQDVLLEAVQEYLKTSYYMTETIEVNAVDLSRLGESVSSFNPGDDVLVYSSPHSLTDGRTYIVSKLSINFTRPDKDKLTLGDTFQTLSLQEQISKNTVHIITSTDMDTAKKLASQASSISSNTAAIEATAEEVDELEDDVETIEERVSAIEALVPDDTIALAGVTADDEEFPVGTYLLVSANYSTGKVVSTNYSGVWYSRGSLQCLSSAILNGETLLLVYEYVCLIQRVY